jgi:prolyl-tRNA synthetase
LKGVPIRLALGPKDLEQGTIEVARRDLKVKETIQMERLEARIDELIADIHKTIYQKAFNYREQHTSSADSFDEFREILDVKGGFVYAHWDGTPETEALIKDKTKATIRLIPLEKEKEEGKCILSGKPSEQRVVFAKAY